MLEAIRKHSASFLVKLLFLVLVLSFVLWGVADVFSPGGGDDWAVEVGDVQIPATTVSNEYQRELRRLNTAFGSIDADQAKALGLPSRVVSQIVDRTLLDLGAADLGVAVSDTLVRQAIQDDPTFRNQLGVFDAEFFRQILSINGLTEDGYVTRLRGDIARNQLSASVASGMTVPHGLVDVLYRYRGERRVAEIFRVDDSAMGAIEDPTDAQLRQFYQDNQSRFIAPEYRAVTAAILSAAILAKEIAVSEEELAAALEDRADELSRPERRTVRQMVLSDEATALKAYDRLAGGADFATVAREEAGLAPDALEMGTVTRDRLPQELADVAFAIAQGTTSRPVQSPLGWHLVEVTAVEPAHRPTLDEVRTDLEAGIAKEKALDALFDLTARLEDRLGGGATLEEAARELNIEVRSIAAIDPQGLNQEGEPVADLPAGFLDAAFATPEKSESPLTEAGEDGHFVLRVDAVTPAAPRSFESVRNEVSKTWTDERRAERSKKAAEVIASRLKGGIDPAIVAAEEKVVFLTTTPFDRSGGGFPDTLPGALIGAVFHTPPGEPAVVRGNKAFYVARPTTVITADPGTDQAAVADLANDLARAQGTDVLSQLTDGLRRHHPVAVNSRVVEQLF